MYSGRRFAYQKQYLLFLILSLSFSACTNHFSEISIYSNLSENDSVSISLCPKQEPHQYQFVSGKTISEADAEVGKVDIALPNHLFKNFIAIGITVNHNHTDSILTLSSIHLKGLASVSPKNIMNTLWWQDGLNFEYDSINNTLTSYIKNGIPSTFPVGLSMFYEPRFIGLQLFFRLSFFAVLLFLLFFLYRQASGQQIILLSIGLFLASVPLQLNYTNWTMIAMSLSMIMAFIWNKHRQFTWQPIFYVLCAIYLMNIIGLLYVDDFKLGVRRLDAILPFVIFPVIFSMIQFTKKNTILLLRFFVWMAITFCAFGLLSYATIVPELTWNMIFADSKLYASLLMMWPAHPHPSYLSTILLMAVPVALYLRFHDGKQITVVEMLLGIFLPIVFTILGGARVGMMIAPILLGLGYFFYCRFKPGLKWGLVVAGIAVIGMLLHLFPKADDRFVDPIRMDLRKTAISAIKEKPVFGWGTGYARPLIHSEERAHSLGIETPHDLSSFHNQYLEDMVQFGIWGIVILVILFGWILWIGIREKNYLLLSLLTIYLLFCWTESALFISKGVIPFTFWLCFLMTNQTSLCSNNK